MNTPWKKEVIIGDARLLLGDCLEILPTLPKVDAVITDPPYSQRTSDGARTDAGGEVHNIITFPGITDERIAALVSAYLVISKRWVLSFCAAEQLKTYMDCAGECWIRSGAWVKPDAMPQFTGDRPSAGFEAIAIMHPKGKKQWNGGGVPAVWSHGFERDRNGHPTPKPIGLMDRLVTLFTNTGETVLDAHAGSGTTGVACMNLGRKFIGIEIEEKYFNIAVERITNAQRQTKLFDEPQAKPEQLQI